MLGRLRHRAFTLMPDPTPHLLRDLSVLVLRAPGSLGQFTTQPASRLLAAAGFRTRRMSHGLGEDDVDRVPLSVGGRKLEASPAMLLPRPENSIMADCEQSNLGHNSRGPSARNTGRRSYSQSGGRGLITRARAGEVHLWVQVRNPLSK